MTELIALLIRYEAEGYSSGGCHVGSEYQMEEIMRLVAAMEERE